MCRPIFLLLLMACQVAWSQKVVKKSIVGNEIELINIDVAHCYRLSLATVKGNEVSIEATIDGEYKRELLLNLGQEGRTYYVSTGFQPVFENPNDKLSAHKVISIALKILVPEYLKVAVYGRSCNVTASGNYRHLSITLNDGDCVLSDVGEEALVVTQSGNIRVYAKEADISANTKYGTMAADEIPSSNNHYRLSSITGNIELKKTE